MTTRETKEIVKILIEEQKRMGVTWEKVRSKVSTKKDPWNAERVHYLLHHCREPRMSEVRLIAEALGFEIEVTLKKGETVYALRKG